MEFIGRLAALVPRLRVNLTWLYRFFAPNSRLREHVVPMNRADEEMQPGMPKLKAYLMTWAQQLKRVFAIEIEKCEECSGEVKAIASIEDPDVIEKILKYLGLDEASQARNCSPPAGLFDYSTKLS